MFCAEIALGFRIDTFSQLLEVRKHDSSVHFAHNAQERDAFIVVTVTTAPFVLIQGDNFGIFHVLSHTSTGKGCHVVATLG